ncbi:MAG: hypothetical protein ACYCTY_15380 [Sulfuricella sp.]
MRTKLVFDLVGYPLRAIAHRMNMGAPAKASLGGTGKELLPRYFNIALQCPTKGQCLAPLGMCQAYLGLLPLQFLAFALVLHGGIGLNNGYHATIHLNDDHGTSPSLAGPALLGTRLQLTGFVHSLRVTLGDVSNGAFTKNNSVVLYEFVHHLSKG